MKIVQEVKIDKEVKIVRKVKIDNLVKRSDDVWRFACGDVFICCFTRWNMCKVTQLGSFNSQAKISFPATQSAWSVNQGNRILTFKKGFDGFPEIQSAWSVNQGNWLFTVKKGFDGSGGGAENSTCTFGQFWKPKLLKTERLDIWEFNNDVDNEDEDDFYCCFTVSHILCQIVVVVERQGPPKVSWWWSYRWRDMRAFEETDWGGQTSICLSVFRRILGR